MGGFRDRVSNISSPVTFLCQAEAVAFFGAVFSAHGTWPSIDTERKFALSGLGLVHNAAGSRPSAAHAGVIRCVGRRFLFPLFHHYFPCVQMDDSSPTGHAIFQAVRASLRLASSSLELLAISDLIALKKDLQATLAVIKGQIQSEDFGTSPRMFPTLNNSLVFHR